MRGRRLHQLRVFTGEEALGNVTGVVHVSAGEQREYMAEWAAMLGYPDAAFVCGEGPDVRVDSFSPFEELRFCTQTVLAAEAVLRRSGAIPDGACLTAQTPAGRVRVTRHGDEVAYVDLPEGDVAVRPPRTALPVDDAMCPLVLDTGRPRLYCAVAEEAIESVVLSADVVRALCAAEGVKGICLTARRAADGAARLRVFTLSLNGAEDASTGGAAGGVALYWEHIGVPYDLPVLTVYQGYGGAQTRGVLRVRRLGGGAVAVGGSVVFVAHGALAHGHQETSSTSK